MANLCGERVAAAGDAAVLVVGEVEAEEAVLEVGEVEAEEAGLAAEGAQGREGRQESPSERARTRGPSSVPLALHKRELLFHDVSIYASAAIVAI